MAGGAAASMPGTSSPGESSAGLLGTARFFAVRGGNFLGKDTTRFWAEDGPFGEFWIHSDWENMESFVCEVCPKVLVKYPHVSTMLQSLLQDFYKWLGLE